jgi:hypothetical protein
MYLTSFVPLQYPFRTFIAIRSTSKICLTVAQHIRQNVLPFNAVTDNVLNDA